MINFDDKLNQEEIENILINQVKEIFNNPNIKTNYDQIKNVKLSNSKAILTLAWMALFSGDNLGMYQLSRRVIIENLDALSSAFYYDLYALSGVFGNSEERLQYSLKVIKSLNNQSSFYLANAYLTHGQILVGLNRLRESIDYYEKAFDLFIDEGMNFAASVSINNACLNMFRMGNHNKVIETVNRVLMITSEYKSKHNTFWEALSLPRGMAYFEIGNFELAKNELEKAKSVIDNLNLIHMHGYIEIYLIRLYKVLNKNRLLKDLKNSIIELFSNMNYPMMDAIVCYAKLHLGEDISEYSEIIMQYYKSHGLENPLIMELCNYFFSKNLVKEPLLDELTTYIDRLRRAGDRTTLILNLLFLADRYAKLNLINEKDEILIEVFELHTKYNYFGTLILYPYEVLPRLTKMFPKVKKYLLDYSVETLTNKEIEIMKLIKDGYTNNQIKETLYISIGTVKWHINNIFSKLGVDNRVAAINEAHRRKII